MAILTDDYGSPWKETLEIYLADCLALFFPDAYAAIDWARGYVFLDKELQQIMGDADLGPRVVDKLVQVWRRGGEDAWVLIHLEVQSQEEPQFAERMFVYYYRLFDRYHRAVASFAILGDEHPRWRPRQFDQTLWGCQVQFTFPTIKLLDYRTQLPNLEADCNPFAAIVLAHLRAQETHGNAQDRYGAKFAALRRLYDLGYNHGEILRLYRLIDWLMRLPPELEGQLLREMERFEEVRHMPYVTSAERIGIEKGMQDGFEKGLQEGLQHVTSAERIGIEKGMQEGLAKGREEGREEGLQKGLLAGIELALRLRFGPASQQILPEIRQLDDLAVIQAVYARLESATTLDEVRQTYL